MKPKRYKSRKLPQHPQIVQNADGTQAIGGQPQLVHYQTGTADPVEAHAKAQQLAERLKAAHLKAYALICGLHKPHSGLSSKVTSKSEVETLIEAVIAHLETELVPQTVINGYRCEAKAFIDLLGKKAQLRPEELTPLDLSRVRDKRLRNLDPQTESPRQCMWRLRFLLRHIPGFSDECLTQLRAPKRQRPCQ
jgi:hypothetical protein